eukprot:1320685-Lingulodinium_polyedra.AAC.1
MTRAKAICSLTGVLSGLYLGFGVVSAQSCCVARNVLREPRSRQRWQESSTSLSVPEFCPPVSHSHLSVRRPPMVP